MDTYEKKYKEALAKAKSIIDDLRKGEDILAVPDLESMFPELKESKDGENKRISKEITQFLKQNNGWNREWLIWLEKQGKQYVPSKEMILNVWELGNIWKEITKGICNTEHGTQLDYILKHWTEGEHYTEWLEKQGEQKVSYTTLVETSNGGINTLVTKELPTNGCDVKDYNSIDPHFGKPTDKVEPKFHEGDWVVTSYGKVNQVVTVDEDSDGFTLDDDTYFSGSWKDGYHLWTIQDAKEGDVLKYKGCIFIFKKTEPSDIVTNIKNPLTVLGYCGINHIGFEKTNGWGDTANCKYHPATKEQRELLFSKMKEAGYEWDAEKKDLKKIEKQAPKTKWSEEDDYYRDNLIKWLNCGAVRVDLRKDFIDWLKSIKQRIGGMTMTRENIKIIIELFISWNGEDEPIDTANLDAAISYIEECLKTENKQ